MHFVTLILYLACHTVFVVSGKLYNYSFTKNTSFFNFLRSYKRQEHCWISEPARNVELAKLLPTLFKMALKRCGEMKTQAVLSSVSFSSFIR